MASLSSSINRKFSNISTVTLLVGPEKTPFVVHKDQLCQVSPFFKAAFTSKFKESSEEKMELPDDDVDSVDLFVQWLYKQACEGFIALEPGKEKDDDYLMIPTRFLIFADKYDIQDCKKYVLDELLAKTRLVEDHLGVPGEKAVAYIYQNTSPGSGLRSFFVDWYASIVNPLWLDKTPQREWLFRVPEFAVVLLVTVAKVPPEHHYEYPFDDNGSDQYIGTQADSSSEVKSKETRS